MRKYGFSYIKALICLMDLPQETNKYSFFSAVFAGFLFYLNFLGAFKRLNCFKTVQMFTRELSYVKKFFLSHFMNENTLNHR